MAKETKERAVEGILYKSEVREVELIVKAIKEKVEILEERMAVLEEQIQKQPEKISGNRIINLNLNAKVIEVIHLSMTKGSGTEDDPARMTHQYWSLAGELLAEHDPIC